MNITDFEIDLISSCGISTKKYYSDEEWKDIISRVQEHIKLFGLPVKGNFIYVEEDDESNPIDYVSVHLANKTIDIWFE